MRLETDQELSNPEQILGKTQWDGASEQKDFVPRGCAVTCHSCYGRWRESGRWTSEFVYVCEEATVWRLRGVRWQQCGGWGQSGDLGELCREREVLAPGLEL
jgi:hypothetical protein